MKTQKTAARTRTAHRTYLNYREEVHLGEKFTKKSMTQPDMALSLTDLLQKHTRGHAVPNQPTYYDSEVPRSLPPEWDTLDIVDRHEYIRAQKERVANIRKELQDQEQAKRAESTTEPASAASGPTGGETN